MKSKLQAILCLLLSVLLCCTLLAACSRQPEAPSPSSADTQTEPADDTRSAVSEESRSSDETASTAAEDSPTESSAQTPELPADQVPITIDNIRDYVIGVEEPIELLDGTRRPLINFDNAATTPALQPVADAVNEELKLYGSIGRGFSQKSNHSTDLYNSTRDKVLQFVGADPDSYTCFYVNNTTDGLNKLASALIESEDDLVLVTRIEHHANDLSWRERCNVIWSEVDEQGRVDYDDMERLLTEYDGKIKYVSVTAASNVTGYVTDVHRVAKMAHAHGAKLVVDGAQIVAHRKFSMLGSTPEENVDFFVFSAHKMYSPYGGGAVVGLAEVLNEHMPEFYGGGIVNIVRDETQTYKNAPASYEAGSPNYPGVVGLGKAIDVLQSVGFDAIEAHEKALNRRLIDGLKKLDNVIIYGDTENLEDRVGVVTFNFSDLNSYALARVLSEQGGVATRRGAFCAHPYVWRLMGIPEEQLNEFEECTDVNTPGMIRISFGIYNTEEEVDQLLEMLPEMIETAKYEVETKYSRAEPAY
ncbi:MAG: aminotransferase class V-fold PLP-dependent enzyme [Oscillospiraceae bacterium]|nr:aminotransferase class V-fold PLP-dependent enzyme [Oscillospiraceae bacterium]